MADKSWNRSTEECGPNARVSSAECHDKECQLLLSQFNSQLTVADLDAVMPNDAASQFFSDPELKWVLERRLDPCYLFSIDPGMTNMASTLASYVIDEEKKTVDLTFYENRMNCEWVCDSRGGINVETIERQLSSWLLQRLDSQWEMGRLCPITVLIERQYFVLADKDPQMMHLAVRLQTIQSILYTLCKAKHSMMTLFVQPQSLRKALQISTGEHAKNKQAGLEFARQLFEDPRDREKINTHHVADCINQAYFYLRCLLLTTYYDQHYDIRVHLKPFFYPNWDIIKRQVCDTTI